MSSTEETIIHPTTNLEMGKFCNVCLKLDNILISASVQLEDFMTISEKLIKCVPEIVWAQHPSAVICSSCRKYLKISYNFRQLCLQTNQYIHDNFSALKNEVVIDEIEIKKENDEMIHTDSAQTSGMENYSNLEVINLEHSYSFNELLTNSSSFVDETCYLESDVSESSLDNEENSKVLDNEEKPEKGEPLAKTFSCSICRMSFVESVDLKEHMIIHINRTYSCDYCEEKFSQVPDLYKHLQTHKEEIERFVCSDCGKGFINQKNLDCHIKVVHKKESISFSCNYCDQKLSSKKNLRKHISCKHSGQRPYLCKYCDKTFKTKAILHFHIKYHNNDRPFKCKYCDKSFIRGIQLKYHVRNHTGERNYQCEECGKRFARNVLLRRHMVVHSADRPFCCATCGGKYKRVKALQRHLKTAHKEKEEQSSVCDVCGRKFLSHKYMEFHIRTVHKKEKPFSCGKCGQSFFRKKSFDNHMRCHYEDDHLYTLNSQALLHGRPY